MMTRKLSTIMRSIFCLTLIIAISAIYGQIQASYGDDWEINLSRLHVSDAQEEAWYSDGDEPYFIMISFRSRFNTPNSTAVWNNDFADDEWAKGVKDGDERNIPVSMGYSLFGNVHMISLQRILQDIQEGYIPEIEILGALVIAMESDNTPFRTIHRKVDDLKDAFQGELERLIEGGELDISDPGPDIEEALQNILESMVPDFWEAVGMALEAGGDVDEIIGLRLFFFVAVGQDVPFSLPAIANVTSGRLRTREYLIGRNPITFRGNGATYRVTARIQPCPVLFAPQNPKAGNQAVNAKGKVAIPWGKIKNE